MLQHVLTAVALMLVLEGVMPFIAPRRWHRLVQVLADAKTAHIRMTGLFSMLCGVGILMWLR